MVQGSGLPECEAAGHAAFAVRKKREINAGFSSLLCLQTATSGLGMVPPMVRMILTIPINSV